MNSINSKLMSLIVAAILISYVLYQTVSMLYDPYTTEVVRYDSYVQDLDIDGFFVRDEKLLDEQKSSVVQYLVSDATKVEIYGSVAAIYNSQSAIDKINQVNELNMRKEILEDIKITSEIEQIKFTTLATQVDSLQNELIRSVDEQDLDNIKNISNELYKDMSLLALVADQDINLVTKINDIEQEIKSINLGTVTAEKTIYTPYSGYFSSHTDGLEHVFTVSMLNNLDVQGFDQLMLQEENTKTSNNIGKMQVSTTWYFVAKIDRENIDSFQEGKYTRMLFSSANNQEVSAKIDSVTIADGDEYGIVVFSGQNVDDDYINMRFERPKVIINEYDGIVIPKEAVRFSKNQTYVLDDETGEILEVINTETKGVYTMVGQTVYFKKVDIIYEDEYFIISDLSNFNTYVSAYDKVVIRGRGLDDAAR